MLQDLSQALTKSPYMHLQSPNACMTRLCLGHVSRTSRQPWTSGLPSLTLRRTWRATSISSWLGRMLLVNLESLCLIQSRSKTRRTSWTLWDTHSVRSSSSSLLSSQVVSGTRLVVTSTTWLRRVRKSGHRSYMPWSNHLLFLVSSRRRISPTTSSWRLTLHILTTKEWLSTSWVQQTG